MIQFINKLLVLIQGRSRRFLVYSFVLGVFWFLVELSFVYVLQGFLFSLGLLSVSKLTLPDWYPSETQYIVLFLILFGALRALVFFFKYYFAGVSNQAFSADMRRLLTEDGIDSNFFKSTSEYITVFSEKIKQASGFVEHACYLAVALTSVFLFLAFGFYYAWKEMFFCLSLLSLIMWPVKKKSYKIQKTGEVLLSFWGNINNEILLTKKNMFFLKVYDFLGIRKNEISKNLSDYEKGVASFTATTAFLAALPMFIGILVLSLCTYASVIYFKTDGIKVLSFFYIFFRLSIGISEVIQFYSILRLNYPAMRDTVHVFEALVVEKDKKINPLSLPHSARKNVTYPETISIDVKNLEFSYDENTSLFKDLNFTLKENDILVIKGPSGVGKSTLLKLILGLEKPVQGNVLYNSVPADEFLTARRDCIGYVGPEPYLIKGTIKDNLLFGLSNTTDISENKINNAMSLAELADDLKKLKVTQDTEISEISFFSTGQQQRLAIARAILRQSRVLVLDEATANLDPDIEKKIIENLFQKKENMIVIIVTHKNSFDHLGTKFLDLTPDQFKFNNALT